MTPVEVYTAPCLAAPYFLYDCLVIDRPFYFAFLHGNCVDNLDQDTVLTTSCFELDTAGEGVGFGQYVHYYSSPWGLVISAALRVDYLGAGFNNAPATTELWSRPRGGTGSPQARGRPQREPSAAARGCGFGRWSGRGGSGSKRDG